MSLYVTLDSNVKTSEQNKISEFRTKLGKLVSLNGNWEVGLSEISYTKSWYNVLYPHKIVLFDELGQIYNSNDVDEEFFVSSGYYESPQKLINEINKILNKLTTIKPPKLIYNELNNLASVEAGKLEDSLNIYPFLGEEIENILGLNNRKQNHNFYSSSESNIGEYIFRNGDMYKKDTINAFHPVEITGGFHSLFVYSDIVYPSLIGDTCASIIRVVDVPRKYKFGDTVHINYDVPHYRPLMLNEFETIEISIKDGTGELIPFKFGRCSLTLHFRNGEYL